VYPTKPCAVGKRPARSRWNVRQRDTGAHDLSKLHGIVPAALHSPIARHLPMRVYPVTTRKKTWSARWRYWNRIVRPMAWTYEVIQDLGSGLNYNKKEFTGSDPTDLLWQSGAVSVDPQGPDCCVLVRNLVFALCEAYTPRFVIINQGEQPLSC